MRNRFILLSVLAISIITNSLYSSDIIELYTKHIPEEITSVPRFMKNENLKLEMYVKLNPDLLPIYINKLNKRIKNKIIDPDLNLTNQFKFLLDDSRIKRNYWAERYIGKINNSRFKGIKKKILSEKFKKFLIDESGLDRVEYSLEDNNENEYLKYLYFSRDYDEEYSANINYDDMNKIEISRLVHYFNEKYHNVERLTADEKKKFLEDAQKYLYLLKDAYLESYTINTDFTYLELLEKLYVQPMSDNFYFDLNLSQGLLNYGERKSDIVEDPFGQELSFDIEAIVKRALFAKLGILIKINSENTAFSYLNIRFGYALSNTFSKTEDQILWSGIRAVPGLSVNGDLVIENIEFTDVNLISAQVNTPVGYLSKNILFEVGFNYIYSSMTYSYNYSIEGTIYSPYNNDDISEMYSEKPQKNKINFNNFFPLLSFNYFPKEWIVFNIDYLIYKNIQFGITLRY